MEEYCEIKPTNTEKIEHEALIMLSNLEEYNKFDKMMKHILLIVKNICKKMDF
jgi:hypothetical protein